VVDALALFLDGPDVALVLEQLEGRIDRAGGGRVASDEPLLELLDDLVSVARLVAEQAQNDELDLARLEHLLPAAPAAAQAIGPHREAAGPSIEAKEVIETPGIVVFAHE
jgi:hypothetical protein